jgi:formate hydrogenlyase subunit 4
MRPRETGVFFCVWVEGGRIKIVFMKMPGAIKSVIKFHFLIGVILTCPRFKPWAKILQKKLNVHVKKTIFHAFLNDTSQSTSANLHPCQSAKFLSTLFFPPKKESH